MARLLVIEDDPTIAQLMVVALLDAGHDAISTPQPGASGWAGEPPSAVVMDLIGLEAYERRTALERVRAMRQQFPGVPVVICTAHARALAEPDRLGADAVIAKPFSVEAFVDTVEGVLRRGPNRDRRQ